MLGKLARLLRMCGHDVVHFGGGEEKILEGRCLLTRDKAMARRISGSLFIEHAYPFHQARQVLRTFQLDGARAFTRCVEDNAPLGVVSAESVREELPREVAESGRELHRCSACGRVYWEGSHVERMRETIRALLDAPLPSDAHATVEESALGRLEPLLDLHQAMDAELWAHRVALLGDRLEPALGHLRRFAMNMARHIRLEEELVLPAYASAPGLEGFPRGGAPDIYRRDHQKILDGLTHIEREVERVAALPAGQARDVARIEALDGQRKLIDLLAHHDHRERAYLYPRLAELLSVAEQEALLERMLEWVGPKVELVRGACD